jgi:septal ring factor EnvC (AmiA/AmiB activator)
MLAESDSQAQQLKETSSDLAQTQAKLAQTSNKLARANGNLAHCKRLGRRSRVTLRQTKRLLALAQDRIVSVGLWN